MSSFGIFANALKTFAEEHFSTGAQNSGHPGTPAQEARYFARLLREGAAKSGGHPAIEALAKSLDEGSELAGG